jgi:hypothetical protein
MVYLGEVAVGKRRVREVGRREPVRVEARRGDPAVPPVAPDIVGEDGRKQDERNADDGGEDEKSDEGDAPLSAATGTYAVLIVLGFYGAHRFRLILRHYRVPR